MFLKVWSFVTVLLAALTMSLSSTHVLEMPQKMTYDAELYSSVNTTMYKYFAVIGGPYTIGAILTSFVLAFLVRKQRSRFHWSLAGTIVLLLAVGAWLALVAPVNNRIAEALNLAPDTVPDLWMQMRQRWEYGHATVFVGTLTGFSLLVISLLVRQDIPALGRNEKRTA